MPRIVVAFVLGLSLAVTAVSADPPQEPASTTSGVSAEKRALINEVLEVTGTANLMETVLDQMLKAVRKTAPQVDDALWLRLTARLKASECLELLMPVYDRYLSNEDLRGLLVFYKSPVGQRVLKAMPLLMQESMQVGQKWGQQKAQELLQDLQREQEENKKAVSDAKPGAG